LIVPKTVLERVFHALGHLLTRHVKVATVCAGILIFTIAANAYPQLCIAQEATLKNQIPTSTDWVVTIGGWGNIAPKFNGSDDYVFGGTPIVDVHWGSREWLSLPKDGLDFEFFQTENFRGGPVADLRWGFGTTHDRGLKEIGGPARSIGRRERKISMTRRNRPLKGLGIVQEFSRFMCQCGVEAADQAPINSTLARGLDS
jgi:hypothetical protein